MQGQAAAAPKAALASVCSSASHPRQHPARFPVYTQLSQRGPEPQLAAQAGALILLPNSRSFAVPSSPCCSCMCRESPLGCLRAGTSRRSSSGSSARRHRRAPAPAAAAAATAAPPERRRSTKKPAFPFTRLAGQEDMKLALLLNVVDSTIGGVLIMGDRGTGKSVAVRSLVELLPMIDVIVDDPFNSHPTGEGGVWGRWGLSMGSQRRVGWGAGRGWQEFFEDLGMHLVKLFVEAATRPPAGRPPAACRPQADGPGGAAAPRRRRDSAGHADAHAAGGAAAGRHGYVGR